MKSVNAYGNVERTSEVRGTATTLTTRKLPEPWPPSRDDALCINICRYLGGDERNGDVYEGRGRDRRS